MSEPVNRASERERITHEIIIGLPGSPLDLRDRIAAALAEARAGAEREWKRHAMEQLAARGQAESRLAAVSQVLRGVEWCLAGSLVDGYRTGACPRCHRDTPNGHTPDCSIGTALAPVDRPVGGSLPAPDLPPGYRIEKRDWNERDSEWFLVGPTGNTLPQMRIPFDVQAWAHYGRALHTSPAMRQDRLNEWLAERDARVRAEQRETDALRLEALADKLSETADGLSEIGNLQAAAEYDQKAAAVRDSAAALRSGADGRDK